MGLRQTLMYGANPHEDLCGGLIMRAKMAASPLGGLTTVLMLGVALYGCGDDRVRPLQTTPTGTNAVASAPTPPAGNNSSKPSSGKPTGGTSTDDTKKDPADDQDD